MRRNMNMLHVALIDQLLVDFLFIRHFQVIRNRHDDHPGLQRFIFLVGNKGFVLRFIRMRDNELIRRNQRKSACLEVPLLCKRKQIPEKLLVAFEHFLKLHQSPIGFIQLAVESIGPWI